MIRVAGRPWLWLMAGRLLMCSGVGAPECRAASTGNSQPAAEIVWRQFGTSETSRVFEVRGVPDPILASLRQVGLSPRHWGRLFSVYVGLSSQGGAADTPAMLGRYQVVEGCIRFQPRYPIERDVLYLAVLDLRRLTSPTDPALPDPSLPPREGGDHLVAEFLLPARPQQGSMQVTRVYPSADVLPENLLKFYLHFSAPMAKGECYRHIRLVQEGGQIVDLPFLELDEELWDREQRRLTLLLDPGRIKEGLKPREESGAILEPGRRYTLHIDQGWRDAQGETLHASYQKSFLTVARDDQSPDPRKWQIQAPSAGSRSPLVVTFAEPLDHAIVSRLLWIQDANETFIKGDIALSQKERRWEFIPVKPWRQGRYQLKADPVIEDVAGNSIGRPFEVDLSGDNSTNGDRPVTSLPFLIQ